MDDRRSKPRLSVNLDAVWHEAEERHSAQMTDLSEGGCYLEVGSGQAMMVRGHFLAVPEPEIALTDASDQNLEDKRAFETQRLQPWFG